jgi:hypothetical protein
MTYFNHGLLGRNIIFVKAAIEGQPKTKMLTIVCFSSLFRPAINAPLTCLYSASLMTPTMKCARTIKLVNCVLTAVKLGIRSASCF